LFRTLFARSGAWPGNSCSRYPHAYAAVSVTDGELDTLIMPHVNSVCMQIFLDEVASRHPEDRIVMVLDGGRVGTRLLR